MKTAPDNHTGRKRNDTRTARTELAQDRGHLELLLGHNNGPLRQDATEVEDVEPGLVVSDDDSGLRLAVVGGQEIVEVLLALDVDFNPDKGAADLVE